MKMLFVILKFHVERALPRMLNILNDQKRYVIFFHCSYEKHSNNRLCYTIGKNNENVIRYFKISCWARAVSINGCRFFAFSKYSRSMMTSWCFLLRDTYSLTKRPRKKLSNSNVKTFMIPVFSWIKQKINVVNFLLHVSLLFWD